MNLHRTPRKGRQVSVRRRPTSFRPSFDALEDRQLLSAFAASAGELLQGSGQGVAADAAGNVYVASNVQGTQSAIDTDAYIAKYASDGDAQGHGVLQWSHLFGGPYGDSANAIAVDPTGNVFVAGDFRGQVDFGNNIVLTSTGPIDGFVEKLDTAGNVLWAHQLANVGNFGPNLYDRLGTRAPKGIALDQSGNVVVTGFFSGRLDMDPVAHPGLHVLDSNVAPNSNASGYVVKLDAGGNFVWQAQSAGEGGTTAYAIAIDPQDNVYTIGAFGNRTWFNDRTANNSNQPNANSRILNGQNWSTIYAWKLNADGTNAWVSQLEASPQSSTEWGLGIAVDRLGNVYTAGTFNGAAVDFNLAAVQAGDTLTSTSGSYDVWIDKLDSGGVFQWVRQAGGVGDDWGTGITLDRAGNPYVTGYISADAMFGNQLLTPVSPSGNSFITELNPAGDSLCSQSSANLSAAAPSGDKAAAIAVDRQGFVEIAGVFDRRMQWPGLPLLNSVGGSSDVFTIKTKLECSPTHASVVDGHILHLEGTNADSLVNIADNGRGTVRVTLDEDAMRVFTGIDTIELLARGGNDIVSYGDPNEIGNPDLRPADAMFDLGRGDDRLTIAAIIGPQDRRAASAWHIDVQAGAGNDVIRGLFGDGTVLVANVDLDAGNDTAIFEFDINSTPAAEGLTVHGGIGDDDIEATYHFNLQPPPDSDQPITVNIDGGKGFNHIRNEWLFNAVPGIAGEPPYAFNIPLISNLNGGDSADISVIYAFNPQPEPPGFPGMVINAPITANLDPARGGNTLSVQFFNEASSADRPPAMLSLNSAFTVNMLGGSGSNLMELMIGSGDLGGIRPLLMSGGSVMAMLDGRAGRSDTIRANMWFDPRSMGHVDAQVLGGRFNDDLTLNIFGIGDPNELTALIDGGPGFDTAHHTANVVVRNCEA